MFLKAARKEAKNNLLINLLIISIIFNILGFFGTLILLICLI